MYRNWGSSVAARIPAPAKFLLRPVANLYFALRKAVLLAYQFRPSVFLLRGSEESCQKEFSTLFLGGEPGLALASELLYAGARSREKIEETFLWRIGSQDDRSLPKTDLVLVRRHRFLSSYLRRKGFLIMPEWVLFFLDLDRPFPEPCNLRKNKGLGANFREFKRHPYSYEITHDPAVLDLFYHRMYVPYANLRYGQTSETSDFHHIRSQFKQGWILLVRNGPDCVAGVFMSAKGNTLVLSHLGVMDARLEYLRMGALTALYYFSITWARENNYKRVDFGHCKSFLNDGVFKYKKRWGMSISRSDRLTGILAIKINNHCPAIKSWLAHNPFILEDGKRLIGFILSENASELSLVEVQDLVGSYDIPGLDGLVICCAQGFALRAHEFAVSHSGTGRKYPNGIASFSGGSPCLQFDFGVIRKEAQNRGGR